MSLSPPLTIPSDDVCELTSAAEIGAAQHLRYDIWESEGVAIHHPERKNIADEHDDHATHWGIFDGDLPVGAARSCLQADLPEAPDGEMFASQGLAGPIVSMNRLVVRRSHRGFGIGRQLDESRIKKAKESNARTIIVTPANIAARRQALERRAFHFLEGVTGHPIWSPTFCMYACYLTVPRLEARRD